MQTEFRRGVDIEVAFRAAALNGVTAPPPSKQPVAQALPVEPLPLAAPASRLRRLLRPLARLVRPLLARVLGRLRASFTSNLHTHLQQSHDTLLAHVEAAGAATRAEGVSATRRLKLLERDLASLASAVSALVAQNSRIEQLTLAMARRGAVPIGTEAILVRCLSGQVLVPSSDPALVACLMDTGDLERGTRLLIERLLAPGDTFVDVGANVGLHSLAAGTVLRGRGRIIAFEPFESTARLMHQSLLLNGLGPIAQTHQVAVADRAGTMPLYLGELSGHHSLFKLQPQDAPAGQPVQVPVVCLDEVIGPHEPVKLLKIDVEGAELLVVRGARQLIARNPQIGLIVEFGPSHLQRTGQSIAEWFREFADLGLVHRVINDMTGDLERWPAERLHAVHSINLLFARPDARVLGGAANE